MLVIILAFLVAGCVGLACPGGEEMNDYDALARDLMYPANPNWSEEWIAKRAARIADALRQAHAAGRAEADVRVARLEAAIASFFRPGPGVAVPEWYETTYEPYQLTWNAKLDALKAALEDAR